MTHESRSSQRPARNSWLASVLFPLASICLFLGTPGAAHAAATEPAWHAAPIWGADVRTMAVHPDDPNVVLSGTSAGQIYLSRDAGRSWADAGKALPFPGWVVSRLQFDPNRHGRLWVALWGIWGSGQVAYTDDLGKSWVARSAGLPDENVFSLALVPGREGILFAGTLTGVYGTEDGGASWRRLTGDLPEIEKVTSLLVDPGKPDAPPGSFSVIAGTWRRAYRSNDGGKTWSASYSGMVLDTEVFSLTPVADKAGEIWASTCGWVYQSRDHGDSWLRFKDGLDERRTTSFAVLPDGRLLAGTVAGLWVSADSGKSWKRQSDPALAVMSIAFHPSHPERILLGTEGSGVWASDDGAANFYRSSGGMTNTRVTALAATGDDLLVGISQAGPISGIHVSHDGGRSFNAEFSPLPTVLDLAVVGTHVYAATERGLFERRGADWFRLAELGTNRVEQLSAAAGGRLVARTATALFELRDGRFVPQAYKHGPPRSAAFFGDALWVTDGSGLYRLTRDANHTIPTPFNGGRLQRVEDQLLLSGSAGTFSRTGAEGDWQELTKEPSRLLPTGDPRYSALLVSGETARLYDATTHRFHAVAVPVPARDISAALVHRGRLMLGTSGYGLLVRDLPEEPAPQSAP
jgi:photosystem II stability/assembly factor-like uncharacterized protein